MGEIRVYCRDRLARRAKREERRLRIKKKWRKAVRRRGYDFEEDEREE
jgi:hypothetical protein